MINKNFIVMKKFCTICILFCLFFYSGAFAQVLENIPYPIEVYNNPLDYSIFKTELTISAKGKTNLFNNPAGTSKVNNAAMALFEPKGDFTLTAKVTGELKAVYDVAALVVYQNENLWAKFCYENSVKKEPTIVSVVTRDYSDDCNSVLAGKYAYMSVVRKGNEFSFFYSADNKNWNMIRNFNLNITGQIKLGFAAHGSRGDGFTAIFSEIRYKDEALSDMRDL